MLERFFIWCAGSDTTILSECSDAERIKHIGFGTLVLIPAILAFVSMSYALTTIESIQDIPNVGLWGGALWGAIIFSLDRFIVSSHRRKTSDKKEFANAVFYLRFLFALFLGVAVSHPMVLLYFNGSISDKISANISNKKEFIFSEYGNKIKSLKAQLTKMDLVTAALEDKRNSQVDKVESEIDGLVRKNARGEVITTGIKGYGPSARTKVKQLDRLEKELRVHRQQDSLQRIQINKEIKMLVGARDSSLLHYSQSYDYLNRELALEELKAQHPIVVITQWVLIIVFILVDILPLTFKTFSPFGMYDKILLDDTQLFKELNRGSRKEVLQTAYNKISSEYAIKRDHHGDPDVYKVQLRALASRYNVQSSIMTGLTLGFSLMVLYLIFFEEEFSPYEFVGFSSIVLSIIGNAIYELLKLSLKPKEND